LHKNKRLILKHKKRVEYISYIYVMSCGLQDFFFRRDLVVMILEYTRKNQMESIYLQFQDPFGMVDSFVLSRKLIKVT